MKCSANQRLRALGAPAVTLPAAWVNVAPLGTACDPRLDHVTISYQQANYCHVEGTLGGIVETIVVMLLWIVHSSCAYFLLGWGTC